MRLRAPRIGREHASEIVLLAERALNAARCFSRPMPAKLSMLARRHKSPKDGGPHSDCVVSGFSCGETEMGMTRHIGFLLVFALTLSGAPAIACDPNENCNRCLVSAFGRCQMRGNDPVCEARKVACRVPAVGPVIVAPGTPLGRGGPGIPGVASGEDLKNCVADPGRCPADLLARGGYALARPIVDNYIMNLRNQASGRWISIPHHITAVVQSQYPGINLNAVHYAQGIDTGHGDAITIGYEIFFPNQLNLSDAEDLELLFHELEHVVQYARRGGIDPFLGEYLAKGLGQIISRRTLNIHDYIDLEQAASAKAAVVYRFYQAAASAAGQYGQPWQPPVQPPYQTPTSQLCVTPAGACSKPPSPIGMSCACPTGYGWVNGIAQ